MGTKGKRGPAGSVTRPHSNSGGVGLPQEHRAGICLWPGSMGVGERIAGGVKAVLCPRESNQGPSEFSPHPQTTPRTPNPRVPS